MKKTTGPHLLSACDPDLTIALQNGGNFIHAVQLNKAQLIEAQLIKCTVAFKSGPKSSNTQIPGVVAAQIELRSSAAARWQAPPP